MIDTVIMPKNTCEGCPIAISHRYFPDEPCPQYLVFGTCMEDRCAEWSEAKERCTLASEHDDAGYERTNEWRKKLPGLN
jgi:hypothetical protein